MTHAQIAGMRMMAETLHTVAPRYTFTGSKLYENWQQSTGAHGMRLIGYVEDGEMFRRNINAAHLAAIVAGLSAGEIARVTGSLYVQRLHAKNMDSAIWHIAG